MKKIYKIALCVLCAHASSALAADFEPLITAVQNLEDPVNRLVDGYTDQQRQITNAQEEIKQAKEEINQAQETAGKNEVLAIQQINSLTDKIKTLTTQVQSALGQEQRTE